MEVHLKIKKPVKKVWKLIKDNIDNELSFGDAKISEKHSNFFINSNNATFQNMYDLINFVKVKEKLAYPQNLN